MYGDSIRQGGVKDCFAQIFPTSVPGRLGEVANGSFGAFRFAKPGLTRMTGLEEADRPLGVQTV